MSNYTKEQLKFINYKGNKSIILSATAGSGKTHSTVGRLNKMIDDGVDPNKIIFFSFTNDAVNELKSRITHDVKVTTIHSFTCSLLGKMKLYKQISTFYDFVNWYKVNCRPTNTRSLSDLERHSQNIQRFYEEGGQISSNFSSYKLQKATGVKVIKPAFYDDYSKFLIETKSRDFSDMLIDTEYYSRHPKYAHYFKNLYDYVFVDEYQDTSGIQMRILLAMEAKQYHLIGDKNQSIYGFSGANCNQIESLLNSSKPVISMSLTKNFRSDKKIVENANKHSELTAVSVSSNDGYVHDKLLYDDDLYEMLKDGKPLAILVRTNEVIKNIEKECLKRRIPMKYFNYITKTDIDNIKKNNINTFLSQKIRGLEKIYGSANNLADFISENYDSEIFVTTIHKSKGREFPRCVVVNSFSPDLIKNEKLGGSVLEDLSYKNKKGDIDVDSKNTHYVAVTRPKNELYFLYYP